MATGLGTWAWMDPLPQGNDLASVACVTSSKCLAVGDAGTILSTQDGGATWSSIRSVTDEPFEGISCANATTCFALAGQSYRDPHDWFVYGTSDGGSTWKRLASGTLHLNAISCPSTTSCFAVGGELTSTGIILASKDGGNTWSTQASPPGDLYGVACPNATTCFAVGGGNGWPTLIYSTSNGGATWIKQSAPANTTLYSVACPNATTCYAVGLNPTVTGGPTIIATTNGGASWVSQSSNSLAVRLDGIACTSATTCFAVGIGPATVLGTTNGGSTWSSQGLPDSARQGLVAVSCSSSAVCMGVGAIGTIVNTSDGGGTWMTEMSTLRVGNSSRLSCASPTHCVAAGTHIYVTSDAGLTWTETSDQTYSPVTALDCPDTQTCYASRQYASGLVSTDGGLTWNPTTEGGGYEDISCPSSTVCYSVSPGSAQLCQITDGATWSCPHVMPTVQLAISCPAISICYVVGSGIYKTSDGGATWTRAQTGLGTYDIDCPAVNVCFAASGGVRYTTDGVTWTDFHSDLYPGSVSCASPTTCYFAGALGSILVTTDQGATWSVQHSGAARAGGLSCPAPGSCFALGAGLLTSTVPETGPAAALLPAVSNGAYGGYTTTTFIENLGTAPANVSVRYFDQAGQRVGTGNWNERLLPHASWTFRQDDGLGLAPGQAGSAIVYSDQPVATVVKETTGTGTDATSYTGVPFGSAATVLYAPAIANNAYGGYTTGIGLLNAGATSADVTVTYRDTAGSVVKTQVLNGLAAHAYRGIYSGDSGQLTDARLPNGFAGTATIVASQPVTAVVNEVGPGNQFSSYDAVSRADQALDAPTALNNAYGGFYTGIAVEETSGRAGTVTLTYYDSQGTPTVKHLPIAASGYLGIYQGDPDWGPAPGAYTATLSADVPIAAIVNEVAPAGVGAARQATSYNTVPGGTATANLPLVESNAADGSSTGLGIMNTGAAATNVTVEYFDATSGMPVGTPQTAQLAALAFWGVYQPAAGLPSGIRASARVTAAAGGVAVICNETTSASFASYDGQ